MLSRKLVGTLSLAAASCLIWAGAARATVDIALVPVGNPGNAPDPATGFGEVDYAYNIGEYDVTAGQYTTFLNAVAATDTYGLYNSNMASSSAACGISQSGSPGSYTYTTTLNANNPVNYVTWGDAARFCNWLSNSQPNGAEGSGTTETGSYTLNGATSDAALMTITRNISASYVIPTENEWYKAAYYNPAASNYYLYPTSNNTAPGHSLASAGTTPNEANYYISGYTDPAHYLTPVGTFTDTPGPYGTYDQGGDVFQWTEWDNSGYYRGLRGGAYDYDVTSLQSSLRASNSPTDEHPEYGFRVALVPEPTSVALLGLGICGLLIRRRRAGR